MIQDVSHKIAGLRPVDVTLAAPRVPEVAAPPVPTELMGLRTSAARPHRRKVPLRRLTAVQA
jgi:hypothetical protein